MYANVVQLFLRGCSVEFFTIRSYLVIFTLFVVLFFLIFVRSGIIFIVLILILIIIIVICWARLDCFLDISSKRLQFANLFLNLSVLLASFLFLLLLFI